MLNAKVKHHFCINETIPITKLKNVDALLQKAANYFFQKAFQIASQVSLTYELKI